MPGSGVTDEPVAMTMFFARDAAVADLDRVGVSKLARPFSHSTLFFLNRNSMPCVRPFTASLRAACIVPRSSSTPSAFTPHLASVPSCASSNSSDAWSSALDGMQPTLRQVPPKRLAAFGAGGLEPELRGADRGDVAAGAGADHQDVEIVISHSIAVLKRSIEEPRRVLDRFLDAHEEGDRLAAVDDAVVVAQREIHHRPGDDLAVPDHRPLLDPVHAEHRRLRRVDDRRRQAASRTRRRWRW